MRGERSVMQPHASKHDWQAAFAGLQFPTSRAAIVNRASDHGGLDHEIKVIVARLPERGYESATDLQDAIRSAYQSLGLEPAALPI
jgi:hypothetical protein